MRNSRAKQLRRLVKMIAPDRAYAEGMLYGTTYLLDPNCHKSLLKTMKRNWMERHNVRGTN